MPQATADRTEIYHYNNRFGRNNRVRFMFSLNPYKIIILQQEEQIQVSASSCPYVQPLFKGLKCYPQITSLLMSGIVR